MPVVVLNHVWEELLYEEIVREGVYVEGEADVEFSGGEDIFASRAACVVDEYGGVADCGFYGGCNRSDALRVSEVAFEELDGWGCCWCERVLLVLLFP